MARFDHESGSRSTTIGAVYPGYFPLDTEGSQHGVLEKAENIKHIENAKPRGYDPAKVRNSIATSAIAQFDIGPNFRYLDQPESRRTNDW